MAAKTYYIPLMEHEAPDVEVQPTPEDLEEQRAANQVPHLVPWHFDDVVALLEIFRHREQGQDADSRRLCSRVVNRIYPWVTPAFPSNRNGKVPKAPEGKLKSGDVLELNEDEYKFLVSRLEWFQSTRQFNHPMLDDFEDRMREATTINPATRGSRTTKDVLDEASAALASV